MKSVKEKLELKDIMYHKMHNPLEFLNLFPMIDWITSLQLLNHDYEALVAKKCQMVTELDLSPLWCILGDKHINEVQKLIQRFPLVKEVSFAYCHNVKDHTILQILENLKEKPANITMLNFFYNNQLTDESMVWICERFPNLVELNVGRCMRITCKSIDKIAQLKNLKKLTLASTELGEKSNDRLDKNNCLERLEILDITGCKNFTYRMVQKMGDANKKLKLIHNARKKIILSETERW